MSPSGRGGLDEDAVGSTLSPGHPQRALHCETVTGRALRLLEPGTRDQLRNLRREGSTTGMLEPRDLGLKGYITFASRPSILSVHSLPSSHFAMPETRTTPRKLKTPRSETRLQNFTREELLAEIDSINTHPHIGDSWEVVLSE